MKPAPTVLSIMGRRWRLVRAIIREKMPDGGAIYGKCDPPETKNKAITIDKRLTGYPELDVLCHEIKHAECFDLYDEEFVNRTMSDLSWALWRLGYRKVAPELLEDDDAKQDWQNDVRPPYPTNGS